MDSILSSIKKKLGIVDECFDFDDELVMDINSVFSVLCQLGVGPKAGFSITSSRDEWEDYLDDYSKLEMVKTYIGMKVRLMFDPPQSSAAIESLKQLISEMEFRLNVEADRGEENG